MQVRWLLAPSHGAVGAKATCLSRWAGRADGGSGAGGEPPLCAPMQACYLLRREGSLFEFYFLPLIFMIFTKGTRWAGK